MISSTATQVLRAASSFQPLSRIRISSSSSSASVQRWPAMSQRGGGGGGGGGGVVGGGGEIERMEPGFERAELARPRRLGQHRGKGRSGVARAVQLQQQLDVVEAGIVVG